MKWTSGEVLVLSQQHCSLCFGVGTREGRGDRRVVCHCVYRAVFRKCLERFRYCSLKEKYIARISAERMRTPRNHKDGRRSVWSFKNEEYMADFVLLARRVLAPDSEQYTIFKYHFLLGASWQECLKHLALSGDQTAQRGEFFHEVYRIESKLGRALGSVEPHALFPTDQYFGSHPGDPERTTASLLALSSALEASEGASEERKRAHPRFPLKANSLKAGITP